jgi:hypothetical protein
VTAEETAQAYASGGWDARNALCLELTAMQRMGVSALLRGRTKIDFLWRCGHVDCECARDLEELAKYEPTEADWAKWAETLEHCKETERE